MDYSSAAIENQLTEMSSHDDPTPALPPSILFSNSGANQLLKEAPACFNDLNLDQIVDELVASKQAYNLRPYFYTPLSDIASIQYRHEVMRDFENPELLDQIRRFGENMSTLREQSERASKLSTIYQKQAWFLELVDFYCQMVMRLAEDLGSPAIQSRGFLNFHAYLSSYIESEAFVALQQGAVALKGELANVRYCLHVKDLSVTVSRFASEIDYSAEVEKTFEKFKHGTVKDYRVQLPNWPDMNQVEGKVIELVARLHPSVFQRLADFCLAHDDYVDEAILRLDREVQFYVAYLEYTARMKDAGLPFCYPQLSVESKEIQCHGGYDLALTSKLVKEVRPVIGNDFYLEGAERIFVVSGPNQGGKTTFARAFGQLHYLARLGCPVPGSDAKLFLSDHILTHFEKEEAIENLRGKLQDDLVRIHDILGQANPGSILILNEIFTSTTIQDATYLSRKVMEQIAGLGCLGVWVTFIDELSTFGPETVSMVSTVAPDDLTVRTFKIERREADGLAYALSLAEKYGLDSESLRKRVMA